MKIQNAFLRIFVSGILVAVLAGAAGAALIAFDLPMWLSAIIIGFPSYFAFGFIEKKLSP